MSRISYVGDGAMVEVVAIDRQPLHDPHPDPLRLQRLRAASKMLDQVALECGLTERQSQVLYLTREGKTRVEVASKLGIRHQVVCKHLKYAKKKIKKYLKKMSGIQGKMGAELPISRGTKIRA